MCVCARSPQLTLAPLLSDTVGAPHATGSIYIENSPLLSDSRAKSVTSGPTQ